MEDILKSFGIVSLLFTAIFAAFVGSYFISAYCIMSLICAFMANMVGEGRNVGGGTSFALGMFLGVLGIIIVACFERTSDIVYKEKVITNLSGNTVDRLIKLADLKERGLISSEEFDKYKTDIK